MFILATIPHGFGCTKMSRTCDTRSLACVRILTAILKKNHVPHSTVSSNVTRSIVDLNRKKPKRTTQTNTLAIKYWKAFNLRIMKIINVERRNKILLLDIHSFPKGKFNGAQITIIDIYKKNRVKLQKFTLFIRDKLNLDVKLFKGLDNYIQNTYQKYTYPLLLEFCEDKTYLSNESIRLFFIELLSYFNLP